MKKEKVIYSVGSLSADCEKALPRLVYGEVEVTEQKDLGRGIVKEMKITDRSGGVILLSDLDAIRALSVILTRTLRRNDQRNEFIHINK